ncbi:ParA family protein [Streptomyces clavifer]|uniref:ParA family protein n=1 Tax=Streptomyces clavifer TaxID=68188 RepID=UPI0033EDBA47
MTESPRTALPPLDISPGERLEVVPAWDADTPYQAWRPQILVPPTFRPAEPSRVYVAVNQKGGAGKTTTGVELAAAWAAAGLRVRVIDADHQEAALSVWLLPQYPEGSPRHSLRSVFFDECSLAEATYPTLFEGVDIVPSGLDLMPQVTDNALGTQQSVQPLPQRRRRPTRYIGRNGRRGHENSVLRRARERVSSASRSCPRSIWSTLCRSHTGVPPPADGGRCPCVTHRPARHKA